VVGRDFVNRFGIKRFHDIGRNLGISHVVVADNGYALPGTVLVCSDTHTGSGGAFNCAARGVGGPDIIYAAIKAETWFRVYPTIRYDIEGKLAPASPRRMCSFISPTPTAIMPATTSSSAGRHGRPADRRPPHHRRDVHRAQRRVCDLRSRRRRDRSCAKAQSRAVHADRSRRRTPAMPRGARSTSARLKSWWQSPTRF
jgi:hypothetical protein